MSFLRKLFSKEIKSPDGDLNAEFDSMFEYGGDSEEDKAREKRWEKEKNEKMKKIKKLLIDRASKMTTSDIDAHLKHQNVDEIKKLCEEMYMNGEISRTGNYRYFILSEEKNKPKKTSAAKSGPVDVKAELKKFKEMLDDGLITQEMYDAKAKELLGL